MAEHFRVNMSGADWLRYQEQKRFRLSKPVARALPYFLLSLLGIMVVAILLDDITYVPQRSLFDDYYEGANIVIAGSDANWTPILKYMTVMFAPFLAIAVTVGWVLHGVGFYVVR